jgi:hypothetical protein
MVSLHDLIERFQGQPILNCPGRYVLRSVRDTDGPEMICRSQRVTRHRSPNARDVVVVTWLEGWGLISYARPDGTWLHTANDAEGFRRKLRVLDIPSGAATPVTSLHTNRGD